MYSKNIDNYYLHLSIKRFPVFAPFCLAYATRCKLLQIGRVHTADIKVVKLNR